MKQWFQQLLVSPSTLDSLVFRGKKEEDGTWLDGVLNARGNAAVYPVENGVPNFVPPTEASWTENDEIRDLELIDSEDMIARNWEQELKRVRANNDHFVYSTASEFAQSDSTILDVASGPGGGLVPSILHFNPNSKVIMSDLGVKIMLRWRDFFVRKEGFTNVAFAGLDATKLPLRSNSLDLVVDSGGFGNIAGSDIALQEALRVLKPKGRLFLNDAETIGLEQFPLDVYERWTSSHVHLREGWISLVKKAGFTILERRTYSEREVSQDESVLGRDAAEHGVRIKFLGQSILALKEP